MGRKNEFNDFSALKSLKKELEKSESAESAPKAPVKSHTVQHRTIHEEHARNIGIEKGMLVRLMDTNDEGKITAIGKDWYEVEIDNLPIRLARNQFVIVDADEDRMMRAAIPSKPVKASKPRTMAADNGDLVVDLHMERIPGNERVPEWASLEYQVDYFKRILRDNLKHRGRRIVFIHGDGDGILCRAIRKELEETFALSCSFNPGPAELYGTGATVVTIR